MNSLLKKIVELRKEHDFIIDTTNSDRYRIVINDHDGTKTAYYFSSPIYNIRTGKLIDLKFSDNETPRLIGSGAQITFSSKIKMNNANGNCFITLKEKVERISDYELRVGENTILPTTNGFLYKILLTDTESHSINIKTDHAFLTTRSNNKYLALMVDKFTPFVSVSAIGIEDENGYIVSPFTVYDKKKSDYEYEISASTNGSVGKYLIFEINMYEKKLVQDTTVESLNPTVNNAFGGTAYLGSTAEFGEQWLYSRIDYMRMIDIAGCRIKRVIAHIPKLSNSTLDVDVYKVSERFCSFGSTWDNRKEKSDFVSRSINTEKYITVDITRALINEKSKQLIATNGLIFIPQKKENGFVAITTGDSCFLPQIYEVNYF